MTILPERLQDVLAAMRSASTQCAEFAGRIEAATALQPSVGGVVSGGKFGAFYVCPTCTGTGVVSEHLASPAQADGWRPIDEAPRDGTWIVARYLSNRPFVARWEGQVWTDGYQAIRDPTHWLKLPEFIAAALRTPAKAVTSHGALRKEEGMITGDELEALIDAAQTTNDSKAVSFLGQVSRELLVQLHGVEAALLAVGKRPPLCDTENAVRHAVGMPWVTSTGTQQEARVVGSGGET